MWICLTVWVGGIIFFSVVEAPAVFAVLGAPDSLHLAGDIVSRSLSSLHIAGFICGIIFLLCAFVRRSRFSNALGVLSLVPMVLVGVMLLLTAFSQFWITQGMHVIRTTNPNLQQLSANDPARQMFDRLHRYSTFTEGGVLLLGLATIVLLSREA